MPRTFLGMLGSHMYNVYLTDCINGLVHLRHIDQTEISSDPTTSMEVENQTSQSRQQPFSQSDTQPVPEMTQSSPSFETEASKPFDETNAPLLRLISRISKPSSRFKVFIRSSFSGAHPMWTMITIQVHSKHFLVILKTSRVTTNHNNHYLPLHSYTGTDCFALYFVLLNKGKWFRKQLNMNNKQKNGRIASFVIIFLHGLLI